MAVTLTVVRSTSLFTDNDENGVVDPADVLRTLVTITNTGDTAATGVTFYDTFTGSTILGGVNISPIAFGDSFTAVANTVLRVGGAGTINGGESTVVAGNLLTNDVGNLAADTIPGFQIDAVTNGVSAKGGTFNINSDGSFNYVNDGTDTEADLVAGDSFTYTIRDAGFDGTYNTADDLTSTATVTITFSTQSGVPGTAVNRVWYVDSVNGSDATGTGTSAKPFATLTHLNGAGGAGDVDAAGHVIYVDGTVNGSIQLEASQQLIGTGEGLNVGGFAITADGGSNSTVNAVSGFGVTLSTGNTIAGVNVTGTGGISGTSFGTLTVSDDVVLNTTGTALSLTTGTFAGTGFASTSSSGGANNVLLSGIQGTVNLGSGALSGATDASGNLWVSGGTATVNYSGNISQANANPALVYVDAGHSGTVTLTGTLSATNGTGLVFNNADGTYNFNGTTTLNGGNAGIDILNGSGGTFTFGSNTALTHNGSSDTAFNVSNSAANVTYNGTITDNSGRAVSIDNADGGAISFTGAINANGGGATGILIQNSNSGSVSFTGAVQLSTSGNDAVTLTNNGGKTITFNSGGAGLDITTTSGQGFVATGGGTITVQGSGNSISTSGLNAGDQGTLHVSNTTIGAADLNFVSISATGGANGIYLNNTGTSGGLTVTGTGVANSGGTIQNSTGDGIVLTNTVDANFNNVRILNVQFDGIDATNLGGTNSFTNGIISDWGLNVAEAHDGIGIFNTNTHMNNFTVSGTAFDGHSGGGSNDAIYIEVEGTSNMRLVVSNSTFTQIFGDGVQVNARSTANGTINVTVQNSQFTNSIASVSPGVGGGNGGVSLGSFGDVTYFADINGNTFTDILRPISNLGAISLTNGMTAEAHLTIRNNTLKDIEGGRGISVSVDGTGSVTRVNVDNNSLDDLGSNHGGFVFNANDSAALDVILNNNRIGQNPAIAGRLWVDGEELNNAILVQALDDSTVRTTISNNTVTANTASVFEVVRVRAADSPVGGAIPVLHATVTGNNITDTHTTNRVELDFSAGSGGTQGGVIHANVSGNNVNGGNIRLGEASHGSADLNVVQTSQANVTAVNNGAAVIVAGSPDFSQPGPQTPTGPTLPSAPIAAAEPPPAEDPVEQVVDNPNVVIDEDGAGGDDSGGTSGAPTVVDDGVLSQAELDLIVAAAIDRWAAAGATEDQLDAMRAVTISVADIGGTTLAQTGSGTITLDDDGAGWRWFVDATPGDDSEYSGSGTRLAAVDPNGHAGTRIDLLTVVMHELGHMIGLEDSQAAADRDELMFGTVTAGERRLPGDDDLDDATGDPVTGSFALSPISLGTLPAGQSVKIEWRHTVDSPGEDRLVGAVAGQAFADSDQTTEVASNAESTNVDALSLGNLVYLDVNKNGLYESGTDTVLAGVTLSLYADTNNNGSYDEGTDLAIVFQDNNANGTYEQGVDTPLAAGSTGAGVVQLTATTNASGIYAFSSLAPGDYIVVVNASNFGSGGALEGKVASATTADPNNNVNNDNNVEVAGAVVATQAIRLDYGLETVAGPTGTALDTNDTLDLAFEQPNQPPTSTNISGDLVQWLEGSGAVLLDASGNATIGDPDSTNFDGGTLTVSISAGKVAAEDELLVDPGGNVTVAGNAVSVSGTQIATFTGGGSGGGDLVFTFDADATPAAVAELVRQIAYLNSGGDDPTDGDRTISWTLVDGDGQVNGGVDTLQFTTTVDVDPVNDEPEGADKLDVALVEDATYTFADTDFGFTDPVDGDNFAGVAIITLPAAGTLTHNGTAITTVPPGGYFVSAADLAANLLTYTPAPDGNGDDYASFTFAVRDDGGTDDGGVNQDQTPNTFSFDVSAVNDAPTVDLNGATGGIDNAAAYTENGTAVVLAPDLVVSDPDDTDVESATVAIGTGFIASADSLTIGGLTSGTVVAGSGSIAFSYNATTGVMTLTGAASKADYQAALRQVSFATSSDDPEAGRAITWTANDGDLDGVTATTTLTVTEVNDAPSGASNEVTTSEDDTYTFTIADFKLNYADAENHDVGAVIITSLPAEGTLELDGTAIDPLAIPLSVSRTDIDDGKLTFVPDADEFGDDYASFGFQLRDNGGTANGGDDTSPTYTMTIDVTPDNVAPVLDLNGADPGDGSTAAVTEQSGPATLAPDLTITDDGTTLAGATVTITSGQASGDHLGVGGFGSGTSGTISWSFDSGTGVLTFTGTASLADYQALLRTVTFEANGDAPGTSRTITWTVTDGIATSNAPTTSVTVTPENDPPAITLADDTVSGTEDTDLVFLSTNGNGIIVFDADQEPLTVTLTVLNGTLTLAQTTGLAVTGDGTGTVELVGSAADITAALEGLVYRGNLNYEGSDTLTIVADDGTTTDTDSIAITLADDGVIDGDAGDNTLNGTPQGDFFDLSQGGEDTADGLGANDAFYMGDELSQGDSIDGGGGTDQMGLQGNYAGYTLGDENLLNIETLVLLSGSDGRFGDTAGNSYDYDLTTVDGNVGAGQVLTVSATNLLADENLSFDGSAETDGRFVFYAGLGDDTLIGGQQGDAFFFGLDGRFTADDAIDGQGGNDQVGLRGDYSSQIVFNADTITNVEALVLISGTDARFAPPGGPFSYNIKTHDGNVAAGQTLVVAGNALAANETLVFDGSAETDGHFDVRGGKANDVLIGGGMADRLYGGLGVDTLAGNGGNDVFYYRHVSESVSGASDLILDFTQGDIIDLSLIDADTNGGGLQAFSFIGSNAFSNTAGELRAYESSPGSNTWFVEGDVDGDGNADIVIQVNTPDSDPITAIDFIL